MGALSRPKEWMGQEGTPPCLLGAAEGTMKASQLITLVSSESHSSPSPSRLPAPALVSRQSLWFSLGRHEHVRWGLLFSKLLTLGLWGLCPPGHGRLGSLEQSCPGPGEAADHLLDHLLPSGRPYPPGLCAQPELIPVIISLFPPPPPHLETAQRRTPKYKPLCSPWLICF